MGTNSRTTNDEGSNGKAAEARANTDSENSKSSNNGIGVGNLIEPGNQNEIKVMKSDVEDDGEQNGVTRKAQQHKCINPTPNTVTTTALTALMATIKIVTQAVTKMRKEVKITDDNIKKREEVEATKSRILKEKLEKKDRADEREAEREAEERRWEEMRKADKKEAKEIRRKDKAEADETNKRHCETNKRQMEQTQNTIAFMTTMMEMIANAERGRTEEAEKEKKVKERRR